MKVSVNSWHYRYFCGISGNNNTSISLCKYVSSIVFWSLLAVIALPLLSILDFALIIPMFLIGFKPSWDSAFVPYNSPISIKGDMIYPYHILAIMLLLFSDYCFWALSPRAAFGVHFTALVIGVVIYVLVNNSKQTNLVRAWIAAKKSGVCPMIEFVDVVEEPTTERTPEPINEEPPTT